MSNASETRPPLQSPTPVGQLPDAYKRPGSNWAQIVSAVCAVFTVLGVFCAIAKFFHDRNAGEQAQLQEQKLERDRQTERALSNLYPLENALSRYLADHVDMQICLDDDQDGALWHKQTANERLQFRAVCAMVADELEYYLIIRDSILTHPRGSDIVSAWDNNLRDYCRNSYGFRVYILRNPGVWTKMFLEKFEEHARDLPPPLPDDLGKTRVLPKKR